MTQNKNKSVMINWTQEKLDRFNRVREQNKNNESFIFENNEFDVKFAKYYADYVQQKLNENKN